MILRRVASRLPPSSSVDTSRMTFDDRRRPTFKPTPTATTTTTTMRVLDRFWSTEIAAGSFFSFENVDLVLILFFYFLAEVLLAARYFLVREMAPSIKMQNSKGGVEELCHKKVSINFKTEKIKHQALFETICWETSARYCQALVLSRYLLTKHMRWFH